MRGRIEQVLDYAKSEATRPRGENPARWRGHLEHLLAKPSKVQTVEHHEALPWQELPAFMTELAKRDDVTARAVAFAILTNARSGEIRGMTWAELKGDLWIVPSSRMKAGKEHRVPLTPAALALIGEPGADDALVFPSSQ